MQNASNMATHSRSFLNNVMDTLTFWEFRYDAIYKMHINNNITPKYAIVYHDNAPVNAYLSNKTELKFNEIHGLIETKNYIFLSGVTKGKYFQMLYCKKNKDSFKLHFDNSNFEDAICNDIDGGLPFFPAGITSDGTLYTSFSLYKFKEYLNDKAFKEIISLFPEKKQKLLNLISKSKFEDNPCLMLVRLK